MREILFRGKKINGGKWVYGVPVPVEENTYETGKIELVSSVNYDELDYYIGSYDSEEVDPNTVGQFTGLVDKNGKKIFEGDIVEDNSNDYLLLCHNRSIRKKRTHRAVVKFGRHEVPSDDPFCWGEAYGFYLDPAAAVFSPQVSQYRPKDDDYGNGFSLEVIGNIHDNPELLEAHNEDH